MVDGLGRPEHAPGLARWIRGTMPVSVRGQVSIALVGDARMRRLNRRFRGADYATDVLSFPSKVEAAVARHPVRGTRHRAPDPSPSASGEPAFLGDIVIATGVAARQARERGHSAATELRILALHGLLHLLGHDHERDDGEMAAVERRLRRRGGLAAGLIERESRR